MVRTTRRRRKTTTTTTRRGTWRRSRGGMRLRDISDRIYDRASTAQHQRRLDAAGHSGIMDNMYAAEDESSAAAERFPSIARSGYWASTKKRRSLAAARTAPQRILTATDMIPIGAFPQRRARGQVGRPRKQQQQQQPRAHNDDEASLVSMASSASTAHSQASTANSPASTAHSQASTANSPESSAHSITTAL